VAAEARAPVLANVVRQTSPAFARLLARAERVRGYFDLAPARLSLEFELVFPHAEQAERARDATRLLARALAPNRGLVGLFARATRVEAVKGSCVARVELEGYELELFKACLAGGPCEVPPAQAATPASGAPGSGEPGEPAPNPSLPHGVP
jgi:hypothetical protein